MISATKGDGVADVRQWLAAHVPAGPWHYPEDQVSDAPLRQLAAEITREKLYLRLHQELPYQSTVETESWKERKDGSVRIEQTIYVERESQRKIVLGKGGQTIKAIGEAARREIAEIIEKKVHLFLFVKVREGWGDDPERYRQMGLEFPKRMIARAGIMVLAWLAGGAAAAFAQARAQDRIHLHTNETEIGEVLRDGGVSIDDPLAAFGAVLKNLPERVQVYPTENYLYFRFTQKGTVYVGNIRLAAADRDQRQGEFLLQRAADRLECRPEKPSRGARSGAGRHGREGRAADLSRHARRPRPSSSRSTICPRSSRRRARCGRTRNSSGRCSMNPPSASFWCSIHGSRCFITFSTKPRRSPTSSSRRRAASPSRSASAPALPSIRSTAGKSWSASIERQSRLNNYLDGPFDQLPENFIEGEALREAILPSIRAPRARSTGSATSPDGSGRFLIGPYLLYRLPAISRCLRAASRRRRSRRPIAPPASSSTTTRRSGRIRARWR